MRIINGLTGMWYLQDPSAWNVTNWNGISPLASLELASTGIDGDYNADGTVDAADYTICRDKLGTTTLLPNDTTPGEVTAEDYAVWKSNFGMGPGSGALAASVPEPSGIGICLLTAAGSAVFGIRGSRGDRTGWTIDGRFRKHAKALRSSSCWS